MAQEFEKIGRPAAGKRPSQLPRYLAIAAALAVVLIVVTGMRGRRSGSVTSAPATNGNSTTLTEAVIPVVAAVVQPSSMTEEMRLTGSLKTDQNVVLSTKLAGKIAMLSVREGQNVVVRFRDAATRDKADAA